MHVVKALPNGSRVIRDENMKLWLYHADGTLAGEIQRGGLAGQLLGLTSEDFGDEVVQSSPEFVVGPVRRFFRSVFRRS